MTAKLTASLAERVQRLEDVFSNPVPTLDGDSASGTWLLSVVAKRNGNYHHGQAPEDVTYIRIPWGWRIQSVRLQAGVFFPLREDVT